MAPLGPSTEKVLRLLREAGQDGIAGAALERRAQVMDARPRVEQLERTGDYVIARTYRRGCTHYRLAIDYEAIESEQGHQLVLV